MPSLAGPILVTGASGFVGRHVLPALRAALPGARLLAAGQEPPPPGWEGFHRFDLAAPEGAVALIRAVRPGAVLHLAAQAAVGESFRDPIGTWRVNLLGTLALAEAVLAEAPGAIFLHASSAECYGLSFQSGAALDESAAFRPANPYAASKAAADLALGELALRGLHSIRLRPFNQVGSGQAPAFVLAAFARQVARIAAGRQPPLIRTGALDRWRDFLDVRDVAAGYAMVLARAAALAPGTAFNLASGRPRRVGDMLADLCALAGIAPAVEIDPDRLRPTDVVSTCGDAGAIRAALGWAPAIAWEATLAAVLADWQARVRAGAD